MRLVLCALLHGKKNTSARSRHVAQTKKRMNQQSSIGFGPDANVFAAYAQNANDKLGNIDFVFENTGPNTAYIRLMQYDGSTSPSGWAAIDTSVTAAPFATDWVGFAVAPGGTITRSYVLLTQRVGFFGSGNTTVNISTVIRNKADLRNAQIDIVAVGRKGWGYDEGFNKAELRKKWGGVGGQPNTATTIQAGQGLINQPDNTGPTGP